MPRILVYLTAACLASCVAAAQDTTSKEVPVLSTRRAALRAATGKEWAGMKPTAGSLNQGRLAVVYHRFDNKRRPLPDDMGVQIFDSQGRLLAARIHSGLKRKHHFATLKPCRQGWRLMTDERAFFLSKNAEIEPESAGGGGVPALLYLIDCAGGRIAVGTAKYSPAVSVARKDKDGPGVFEPLPLQDPRAKHHSGVITRLKKLSSGDVLLVERVFSDPERLTIFWVDGSTLTVVARYELRSEAISPSRPLLLETAGGFRLVSPTFDAMGCFNHTLIKSRVFDFHLDAGKKQIRLAGKPLPFVESATDLEIRVTRTADGGFLLAVPSPDTWLIGMESAEPRLYPTDLGIWRLSPQNQLTELGTISQVDAPYAIDILPMRRGKSEGSTLVRLWGHESITTFKIP